MHAPIYRPEKLHHAQRGVRPDFREADWEGEVSWSSFERVSTLRAGVSHSWRKRSSAKQLRPPNDNRDWAGTPHPWDPLNLTAWGEAPAEPWGTKGSAGASPASPSQAAPSRKIGHTPARR